MENVNRHIENEVATALRHVALDESVKSYVLQHPSLYKALLNAAARFIGGETLVECCAVAKQLNEQGHAVTIDFMGESTLNAATAEQATQTFMEVIRTIAQQKLDSSVSYDLSHLGMVIDPELGYENACRLAKTAKDAGIEIMISMEGTDRTTTILDIYRRLGEQFDNVGVTVQAFLYRTPADLASVLERPGKIRLVKGAYEAPSHLAMSRGWQLDSVYQQLVEKIIDTEHLCSIASHDPAILDQVHQFIGARSAKPNNLEFEMLKGVTPERLEAIRGAGYRTRVYLPYGQEWHLYVCNRLAEYPPNIYQAIADAVRIGYT